MKVNIHSLGETSHPLSSHPLNRLSYGLISELNLRLEPCAYSLSHLTIQGIFQRVVAETGEDPSCGILRVSQALHNVVHNLALQVVGDRNQNFKGLQNPKFVFCKTPVSQEHAKWVVSTFDQGVERRFREWFSADPVVVGEFLADDKTSHLNEAEKNAYLNAKISILSLVTQRRKRTSLERKVRLLAIGCFGFEAIYNSWGKKMKRMAGYPLVQDKDFFPSISDPDGREDDTDYYWQLNKFRTQNLGSLFDIAAVCNRQALVRNMLEVNPRLVEGWGSDDPLNRLV